MKQAAIKAFLYRGANELCDEKIHKLVESQGFTQGLLSHVMKSKACTMGIVRFVKLQADIAIANK